MADEAKTDSPPRITIWIEKQLRRRALRRTVRELEQHYAPLLANAKGDREQALLAEWSFEAQWAESELAQFESAKLRRLADRWNVEAPSSEQDSQAGIWYIPYTARIKLRREIREAKRESIRWWIQVVVMPLVALVSSATALISLFYRLK